MGYRVILPEGTSGKSYTDEDITLAEAAAIEAEVPGETWLTLSPLASARHLCAVLLVFLRREMSDADARAVLARLSPSTAIGCIDALLDDDRPKAFEDGLPVVDPKGADGSATTS